MDTFFNKDGFCFGDSFELTPEMLESISGGTPNETSDNMFRALLVAFKHSGRSREELENFILNSNSVFTAKGMEGVTMDDAYAYIDENWDKY